MNLLKSTFSIFFLFLVLALSAQDSKLASQYYQSGEYEKAADMYKMLTEKTKYNDYYFSRYINCLLALEEYDQSEKDY